MRDAEISFAQNGRVLVVTEKGTNQIDAFVANEDGSAKPGIASPSAQAEPFGFAFGRADGALTKLQAGAAAMAAPQL